MTVKLVGIAGGSGAGKSWFAERLVEAFAGNAGILAEDDYYHCSTLLPDFDPSRFNFDEPQTKDHALLMQHLGYLRQRQPVERPDYDFATHSRTGSKMWGPYDVVIVEGIHTLTHDPLVAMLDISVWIDAPDPLRYQRRLARDVVVRKRTPESVEQQWQNTVAPAFDKYADIQRNRADIVLKSEDLKPGDGTPQRVLAALRL